MLQVKSDGGALPNWYVVDGTGKPVAGPFRTREAAEAYIASKEK
jgi:hypothetical protein